MCCAVVCEGSNCNGYTISTDGKCVEVPPYMIANDDFTAAVDAPECINERDILEECGSCKTCPEYTYPNADKTECIADTCEGESWLKKDGTC